MGLFDLEVLLFRGICMFCQISSPGISKRDRLFGSASKPQGEANKSNVKKDSESSYRSHNRVFLAS